MITIDEIKAAYLRIKPYVNQTPIVSSSLLNRWLGHEVFFKAECLQKVGAFKARGACNAVLKLIESGNRPTEIVANSSGNHAQAVAWSASLFGIKSTIFMPSNVSKVKAQATKAYGAKIVLGDSRQEVDAMVASASQQQGCYWIPPFNHVDVIAGQGTSVFEALQDEIFSKKLPDAVFAPCGGGGLLSGSFIASKHKSTKIKVMGVEPLNANDAAQSYRAGKIIALSEMPDTLADGAMTLAVGDITFDYLKQLDDFFEVDESRILYWTQWLQHLLKLHIEPTSAMCMDAVCRWLSQQSSPQKVLVILSGGNLDQEKTKIIWQKNYLNSEPRLLPAVTSNRSSSTQVV